MTRPAYTICKTSEYDSWLTAQTAKSQLQILQRVLHIEAEGHFGDHKDVNHGVWELRWKSGRRVYYTYIPEKKILLLLGGNKNGQSKDIRQAQKVLCDHTTTGKNI